MNTFQHEYAPKYVNKPSVLVTPHENTIFSMNMLKTPKHVNKHVFSWRATKPHISTYIFAFLRQKKKKKKKKTPWMCHLNGSISMFTHDGTKTDLSAWEPA